MNRSTPYHQRDIRYEPDERPPYPLSLGLGIQIVLLNIGGVALMPAIIIRAAGIDDSYLIWAVFAALCICGISTVLQAVRLGRIGAGYSLLMGTAGAFTAASVSALAEGGPGLLATLVVASSMIQFVLSSRLSLVRRLITPLVAGTVMMLVAVTIMPIAFDLLTRVPAEAPPSAAPASAAATVAITAVAALLATGPWRVFAPVLGGVAGCSVAGLYGIFDTTGVALAPWIGLPSGGWPGFDLTFGLSFWTLLPVFVFAALVAAIGTIGDSIGIQQVSWRRWRATDFRSVQGAVAANGVGNLLSGLAGTVPNTSYSSSVAVAKVTGVASRLVGISAGILLVAIALLPKALAAILAIPNPVVAAYIAVLMAMLFIAGMRTVVQDGLDYRKSVLVGVAFWLGFGFQNAPVLADQFGGPAAAIWGNGMATGGLAAFLMTLAMDVAGPRRRRIEIKLHTESIPAVHRFLRTFATENGWDAAATYRLRAAAEEALLSLIAEEEASESDGLRRLVLIVRGDRSEAELEFFASLAARNLEERLTVLPNPTAQSAASESSLRLLRHYAASVQHRQYHDTDVITVRVKGN